MNSFKALEIISKYRGEAIVIPTQTTNNEWSQISTNRDLDLMFSAGMGQASSVGLGLALARPDKKVVIFDGDGSLLMNLGTLVTIGDLAPPNLIHFVFENGIYRTTGGQSIPGRGKIHFSGLAKAAAYANVYEFDETVEFTSQISKIMTETGPTFVRLLIESNREKTPYPFTRTLSIISRFKKALADSY